jgi:hypothetical protein
MEGLSEMGSYASCVTKAFGTRIIGSGSGYDHADGAAIVGYTARAN